MEAIRLNIAQKEEASRLGLTAQQYAEWRSSLVVRFRPQAVAFREADFEPEPWANETEFTNGLNLHDLRQYGISVEDDALLAKQGDRFDADRYHEEINWCKSCQAVPFSACECDSPIPVGFTAPCAFDGPNALDFRTGMVSDNHVVLYASHNGTGKKVREDQTPNVMATGKWFTRYKGNNGRITVHVPKGDGTYRTYTLLADGTKPKTPEEVSKANSGRKRRTSAEIRKVTAGRTKAPTKGRKSTKRMSKAEGVKAGRKVKLGGDEVKVVDLADKAANLVLAAEAARRAEVSKALSEDERYEVRKQRRAVIEAEFDFLNAKLAKDAERNKPGFRAFVPKKAGDDLIG